MDTIPIFSSISIQTNSKCNLRCKFCLYGQYDDYCSNEILSSSVIEKIISELCELNFHGRVAFYNLNEPLTDDRIFSILESAHTKLQNAFHFFSTNGILLDQTKLDTIIKYSDHVRINQYTSIPKLDYSHSKIDMRNKKDFLNKAESNRAGSLKGLPSANYVGHGVCANPFGHMVIMPPGVVVLCCADAFKQLIMGDIRKQSLVEIWQGEPFQQIRKNLVENRRHEISLCRKCSIEDGNFFDYFINHDYFNEIIKNYRKNLAIQ